jgi:CheY-like chemotaxis protein
MSKKRILIVDDETSITQLLRLNLEQTGRFAVRAANTASDAITALPDFQPDLILMDVMMPGTDGGTLAERIRATRSFRQTPIVFLTAAVRQEEVDARDGVIGGFPYIAKPLNVRGVIEVIEYHLGMEAAPA